MLDKIIIVVNFNIQYRVRLLVRTWVRLTLIWNVLSSCPAIHAKLPSAQAELTVENQSQLNPGARLQSHPVCICEHISHYLYEMSDSPLWPPLLTARDWWHFSKCGLRRILNFSTYFCRTCSCYQSN